MNKSKILNAFLTELCDIDIVNYFQELLFYFFIFLKIQLNFKFIELEVLGQENISGLYLTLYSYYEEFVRNYVRISENSSQVSDSFLLFDILFQFKEPQLLFVPVAETCYFP